MVNPPPLRVTEIYNYIFLHIAFVKKNIYEEMEVIVPYISAFILLFFKFPAISMPFKIQTDPLPM